MYSGRGHEGAGAMYTLKEEEEEEEEDDDQPDFVRESSHWYLPVAAPSLVPSSSTSPPSQAIILKLRVSNLEFQTLSCEF